LRFLRSATVYNNNVTDINSLVAASAEASPIITDGTTNYATFTMPTMTKDDDNLYLIWDYRNIIAATLCTNTTAFNACCGCVPLTPTTPCGSATAFSGGVAYPDEQTYTLGSGTGIVNIEINVQQVPDRLIVEFDGAVVVDTQYLGDFSDFTLRQLHNNLKSINPATGTYYVEPNGPYAGNAYAPNGAAPLPTIPNGGCVPGFSGKWFPASFQKTTATTTCTIKVYAPIPNTKWDLRINCPT